MDDTSNEAAQDPSSRTKKKGLKNPAKVRAAENRNRRSRSKYEAARKKFNKSSSGRSMHRKIGRLNTRERTRK